MAPANTNSDPDDIINDNEDDTPAPSVYPISQTEQQDLVETALSHIDAMIQHVTTHSNQPIEPPQECPASSLFVRLRIGSRNSKLALIQASSVAAALFKVHHHYTFPISTHKVQGDVDKKSPFLKLAAMYKDTPDAAKSLWTMEIEERLLAGDIDMIVHSLKDVPTVLPGGCALGVFPHRQDPTDAFVVRTDSSYRTLDELPMGSVVGTSSVRRTAQLRHFYPHINVQECRGNVSVSPPFKIPTFQTDTNISDSRLAKLDAPDSPYTAIVIATAGLVRLNLEHRITARLSSPEFLHAVGQGALGIEIRSTDEKTRELIKPLDHWPTRCRCLAERSLLRYLQGGCSAPIGVQSSFHNGTSVGSPVNHSLNKGDVLCLTGALLHPHGGVEIRARNSSLVRSDADAEALGVVVAKRILELGGGALLALLKDAQILSHK
jgi:hydroxymethylbilane synthase